MSLLKKILTYEPVMSVAFATAFLAAIANVLRSFGVYDLTVEEQAAVLSVLTAFGPVVGFVVRQQVKPTAKTDPVYGH